MSKAFVERGAMPERITVAALALKFNGLDDSVGKLSGQLDGHLKDCAQMNRDSLSAQKETNEALKRIADKVSDFEKLPMKAVRWIGGLIVASIISVLAQNFFLHQDTAAKAQVAAVQASAAAQGQQTVIRKLDALAPPPQ